MNKWIYLKSNNPADALALASVIATSDANFNIVRKSFSSKFFKGLENILVDYYEPSEDSEISIIEEIDSDSWKQKCDTIASILGLGGNKGYKPYEGFVRHISDVEKRIEWNNTCLLYLFPHPDQNLDLPMIDHLVKLFELQGVKSISGGTYLIPCIKGTTDLRQVIDHDVLCAILPKLKFIITSEKSVASICEAFGKEAFVVSQIDSFTVDGLNMADANQIINYINQKLNNL